MGTDNQVPNSGPAAAVFRRTVAGGTVGNGGLAAVAGYTGDSVRDLVMDDKNWMNLFVADNNQVFRSTNAGNVFTDVTFGLSTQLTDINTLEFISNVGLGFDLILAGGLQGVFYAYTSNLSIWTEVGGLSLPNAPVMDLFYDPIDDLLVVGTHGREGIGKLLLGSKAEEIVRQSALFDSASVQAAPAARTEPRCHN